MDRPKIHAPTLTDTEFINDGPDFCATGHCIRWKCRECDYVLFGQADGTKIPFNYCPMCGRKVKRDG